MVSKKRINDLLDLMITLNNVIASEIREVNRGRGHSAKEIEESLKYWIEDRIAFMQEEE